MWRPEWRTGRTTDRTPARRTRARPHAVTAGVVAVVLVALAGCSVGGDSGDAEGAGGAAPAVGGLGDEAGRGVLDADGGARENARPGAPTGEQADDAVDEGGGVANRPSVRTRAVIRTGEVALVTKTMNRARAEIDALLGRHGGYLASEDTRNDRVGRPTRSVLVLRVPEPAFDTVMTALGRIGRTERADRSSEDVTTELIDVDTRVRTQEASLARLQRLLGQASDIDDMIRLESEIATRQASLESLKAQQKYLSDQTAMSTITVRLRTPASPPAQDDDDAGFLAGLSEGWAALRTVLLGAATLAGVLLPFTVAIALLAVPLWFAARAAARRRPRSVPVVASGPPTPPDA